MSERIRRDDRSQVLDVGSVGLSLVGAQGVEHAFVSGLGEQSNGAQEVASGGGDPRQTVPAPGSSLSLA